MDFSPKEREAMGGVPSTKVVGKSWRVLRIYSLASIGNTVREARHVVCGKDSWHWWNGGLKRRRRRRRS
jgi:hypothetical protein